MDGWADRIFAWCAQCDRTTCMVLVGGTHDPHYECAGTNGVNGCGMRVETWNHRGQESRITARKDSNP